MQYRIRQMDLSQMVRLILTRLQKRALHFLYSPLWMMFKMRYAGIPALPSSAEDPRTRKEDIIRHLLKSNSNGSFLEIGIGEYPRFDRFDLMRKLNVQYVGCDFEVVCKSHAHELGLRDTDMSLIKFKGNERGTYAWTLFEMLRDGTQYDIIYVDGHHTFYIDLPAILLADQLLKPGGYLLIDDITWTLDFLRANMSRSLSQWYFYRTMYNFSDYSKEQRALPHMQMIAEDILIARYGYHKDEEHSLPYWWMLRKPNAV